MPSPLYSNLRNILKERDEGPVSAAVIVYPKGLVEEQKRKEFKRTELRGNPECLFVDYKLIKFKKKNEQKKVKTNFLFYTEHPKVWHSTLSEVFPHRQEKRIDHGRQVKVFDHPDAEKSHLTFNIYDNGTIMVQGSETNLNEFEKNFLNLKTAVEQRKPAER